MLKLGKISQEDHDEIIAISKTANNELFMPLLCVIPRVEVIPYYKKVEIKDKANPLSHEYILSDLPHELFDIIKIG